MTAPVIMPLSSEAIHSTARATSFGSRIRPNGLAAAARSEIHRRMLAAEDAELQARLKPAAAHGRAWRYAAILSSDAIQLSGIP